MEDIIHRTKQMLSEGIARASEQIVDILPEAVFAVIIVIIGWLGASILTMICKRVLNFFAIDKLVGKTPLDRILKNIGFHKSITEIIAMLVFWMTILFTLVFASEALHLQQISDALAAVTRYIPQVIAALLIIVFGMLLARFLQMLSEQTISRMEIAYDKTIGKVVHIVVMVFVILAAIEQLGLDLSFITTNVVIVLSAVLLVAGIGLVISARAALENMLICQHLKQRLAIGDDVELGEVRGEVAGFSLSEVILTTSTGEVVIPAAQFSKQPYTKHTTNGAK